MSPREPPGPKLTADVVAFAGESPSSVLLIRRGNPPFEGEWALPGGFVDEGERVRHAAARELAEETGVQAGPLRLLGVYDRPGRDPRGWTVSVVYVARFADRVAAVGGDDAVEARWWDLTELPELAFDHAEVLADAVASAAPGPPTAPMS